MDPTVPNSDTERGFEVGKDEAWFANVKRTYDEYQQESLETIRHMRAHFDKLLSDAQQFDNQRQVIANQALQNAVTNADLVTKQFLQHNALATDRQWNVDEVSDLVAKSGVQADAIASALAGKVADILGKKAA